VRASKQTAVAALDAAELAAGAVGAAEEAVSGHALVVAEGGGGSGSAADEAAGDKPKPGEQSPEEDDVAASDDDSDNAEASDGEVPPGGSRKASRFTAEARRDFEARQALRTMLEAVRMLRTANTEVIRLQRMARQVGQEQQPGGPAAAAAAAAAACGRKGCISPRSSLGVCCGEVVEDGEDDIAHLLDVVVHLRGERLHGAA